MGQNDPFERMDPTEARDHMKLVTAEIHKPEPNTLITLYEIDISEIKANMNLNDSTFIEGDILAFHNMEILQGKKIKYDGHTYFAMPISMEGFEMTSSGELPRPTMIITSLEGIDNLTESDPNNYVWLALKRSIIDLDNLTSAKVTRIRTFAKYLDSTNEIPGVAESPDPFAQFPREVYYVDSKTKEDKNSIQFELSSFQDIENFKLPGRFVLSSRCPFSYRGNGCCYEFKDSSNQTEQKEIFGALGHIPDFAPPISTEEGKLISEEVGTWSSATPPVWQPGYNPDTVTFASTSEYNRTQTYAMGSVVYIKKNGIKYYFVAKGEPGASPPYSQPVGQYVSPPNVNYWVPDRCSKTIRGCKKRFGSTGAAKDKPGSTKIPNNKFLNFGGFPGTNTRISV